MDFYSNINLFSFTYALQFLEFHINISCTGTCLTARLSVPVFWLDAAILH